VGMRPDLVGQGRGAAFAEAVFAHARTALQAGSPLGRPRLRAVVPTWNERSLRLLARAGFEVVGHHVVEQQQYVVLERDA
jgi:[ribosomal protein S18]-alanine N-acetyltransferase